MSVFDFVMIVVVLIVTCNLFLSTKTYLLCGCSLDYF